MHDDARKHTTDMACNQSLLKYLLELPAAIYKGFSNQPLPT